MAKPKLPQEDFIEVVRNTPLVSIDIVARSKRGEVLLGLRKNEPAKGYWFVPGGSIRKNELLDEAYERITRDELGARLLRKDARLLGVYEHIYDTNFAGIDGFGTHYVVIGYEATLDMEAEALPSDRDDQNAGFKWMGVEELLAARDVHRNTKIYFK
jgi:colanic acid biosynthesis protein WcaH